VGSDLCDGPVLDEVGHFCPVQQLVQAQQLRVCGDGMVEWCAMVCNGVIALSQCRVWEAIA
jgi:ribosomal protein S16